MFNEIDLDNDGFINLDDLQHFLEVQGGRASAEKADAAFEGIADDDGEGIDFDAFCHYILSLETGNDRLEFLRLLETFRAAPKPAVRHPVILALKSISLLTPDTWFAAVSMWWLNRMKTLITSTKPQAPKFHHHINLLMWPFVRRTKAEHFEWESRQTKTLPYYFIVCDMVATELYNSIREYFPSPDGEYFQYAPHFDRIVYGFCVLMTVTPIGHPLTLVGQRIWYIVLRKYYIFLLVCLGIWTDEVVESYDLDYFFEINKEEKKENDKDHVEMSQYISLLVGCRVILLQIIPLLSFLSIYAMNVASSPPFIPYGKAQGYFPPLFIDDAMDKATRQEMSASNHKLTAAQRGMEWVVKVKAITIFVDYSRGLQSFQNIFSFVMSVGVLFGDTQAWLVASFFVYIPLILAKSLQVFIFTGMFFEVRDCDLEFFPSLPSFWGSAHEELEQDASTDEYELPSLSRDNQL